MNPEFPIFVPTKGRYKTPLTIKCLERINVPYSAVIEEQEYNDYSKVVKKGNIIVLPHRDKGLIATRNWIWDYAQYQLRTEYFWTFDDNIRDFYRLYKNIKYRMQCGTFLKVIEDFAQRYENLYITGMQYEMFAPRKRRHPPVLFNTRVYSNMFIKTDIPYRNELFYNDDTDLCLRILKDGYCTALIYAFLADKIQTMKIKGGMTDYYEKTDKRLQFAQMLQRAHPDVVRIVWKFNRWHHEVNYDPFKANMLKKKSGLVINNGVNEYDMRLSKGPP